MLNAIIFGLGNEFENIHDDIQKYYKVVAYSDNRQLCNIKKFVKPCELKNVNADVLIICSKTYFLEIKSQLRKEYKLTSIPILGLGELSHILYKKDNEKLKNCVCCGGLIEYEPLPLYYEQKLLNSIKFKNEFLNEKEYLCPQCGITDRSRLIISFLKICGFESFRSKKKLLHIGAEAVLEKWITENCSNVLQDTTDLYRKAVIFKSDIQNMDMVESGYYDFFICSHVLEHVKDDRKGMRELYRILNEKGIGVFLVPICMNYEEIDEEWGLTEEENWKRFGQGDHCRRYAKKPLIKRLEEAGFYVNCLGKNFFGEHIFWQNGLVETSAIYILTKKDICIERIINENKLL